MLDVNEAHKVLGVNKNASKNDIERRYSILLKKHRMNVENNENADETIDIDQVTMAYNLLMGYVVPPSEEELKAPNPLIAKMGIDEKKAKNFFYYYKVHMIIGVIALIVIAFTIKGCVTEVKCDFNLAFVGNIAFTDTEALKNTIKAQIPQIKEPRFDSAYLAPSVDNSQQGTGTQTDGQQATGVQTDAQQESAMQMKAMILFSAADVDLFILDNANYKKYAEQGAFISLDEIAASLGVDKEKSMSYILKNKDDNSEHIYGINVADSEVLKKAEILGDEMVAAIPVRSKQSEKAILVLKLLLK